MALRDTFLTGTPWCAPTLPVNAGGEHGGRGGAGQAAAIAAPAEPRTADDTIAKSNILRHQNMYMHPTYFPRNRLKAGEKAKRQI